MEKYDELKCYQKSIRMTETQFKYIDSYPEGKNFNEKFERIMDAVMQPDSDKLIKEKALIQVEIEQLQSVRNQLSEKIKETIQGTMAKLDKMNMVSQGEMIVGIYQEKDIQKMLTGKGYKPDTEVVKNIIHLNEIMKKKHSMADLSTAYQNNAYEGNHEAQETLHKIGQALQSQELQLEVE